MAGLPCANPKFAVVRGHTHIIKRCMAQGGFTIVYRTVDDISHIIARSALVDKRAHTREQWSRNHVVHGMGGASVDHPSSPQNPHHLRFRSTYRLILSVGIHAGWQ